MQKPVDVILKHLDAVQAAFAAANGSASGAWLHLTADCPAVTSAMAPNSFRVLAPAIHATAAHLKPPPPPTPLRPDLPGNFMGWTVGLGSDKLIRLHRRIDGRLRSLYIGKTWDADKAEQRIKAYELKRLEGGV